MADSKLVRLVRILIKPFQDLENAFQQLLLRSITDSTGAVLTQIGKLVGQERNGITDDEIFRRYVRARIATNSSTMVGEDIINVLRLVIGDDAAVIQVNNNGDAAFEVTIRGVIILDDLATIIIEFLHKAVGTGIRATLITLPAAPAGLFKFAGSSTPGPGFGDKTDPGNGGVFVSGRD